MFKNVTVKDFLKNFFLYFQEKFVGRRKVKRKEINREVEKMFPKDWNWYEFCKDGLKNAQESD